MGVTAQTSAVNEGTPYSQQRGAITAPGVAATAPGVAATRLREGVSAGSPPLTHCIPPIVSTCKHVGLGPNKGIQLLHRKSKPQFLSSAPTAIPTAIGATGQEPPDVVISTSQGITVVAILPRDCDTPGTSGLRYPLSSKRWVLREILLGETHISRAIRSSLWVWETWPSTEQRPYEGSLH